MAQGAVFITALLGIAWFLVAMLWVAFGNDGHPPTYAMALLIVGPLSVVLVPLGAILGMAALNSSPPISKGLRQTVVRCGMIVIASVVGWMALAFVQSVRALFAGAS
jgi:hypothetical protein